MNTAATRQLNMATVHLQNLQDLLKRSNSPTPTQHLLEAANKMPKSPELTEAARKRLLMLARLESNGLGGEKLDNLKRLTVMIGSKAEVVDKEDAS